MRGQQVQCPRGGLAAALAGGAQLAAGALGPRIGAERVERVPRGAQRRAGLAGLLAAAQPHAVRELQPGAVQRPGHQAGAEGSIKQRLGVVSGQHRRRRHQAGAQQGGTGRGRLGDELGVMAAGRILVAAARGGLGQVNQGPGPQVRVIGGVLRVEDPG